MIKHLNITVRGTVQGVGFRYHTKEEAERLKLTGLIKNQPNLTVYIEIEGEEKALDEFKNWCQNGPDRASVESLDIQEGPLQNFTEFNIM